MKRRDWIAGLIAIAAAPARSADVATKRVVLQPAVNLNKRENAVRWFARHGWEEGHSLILETWKPGPRSEWEGRAHALIATRPDLIMLPGGDTVAVFKRLTREIPIVFYSLGGNPVKMGLVDSFQKPGGNVTGTTNQAIDRMVLKGFELLRTFRPGARRLGALFNEGYLGNSWVPMLRQAQVDAAIHLGLERREIVVPENAQAAEIERIIVASGAELLDVNAYVSWASELKRIVQRLGIPTLWESADDVRAGGLVSVIGSIEEACREAIRIAAAILGGSRPSDIPVREVTRFEIAVNLRTARAMGLAVPMELRLRADQVFDE